MSCHHGPGATHSAGCECWEAGIRREEQRRCFEDAAVLVEGIVTGCSCAYAPCEHDDLREQLAKALRTLKERPTRG